MINDTSADTEFNDALIANGIIPPREPPPPTDEDIAEAQPSYADMRRVALTLASKEEVDDLLDSDPDSDEERLLLSYRANRMQEMKDTAVKDKYGSVTPFQKQDYLKEVNQASMEGPVVCFLYREGSELCDLAMTYLKSLAREYKQTKFVSIIGNMCIADYPDEKLPTILIYNGGKMSRQVVGLPKGLETTRLDVETLLLESDALALKAEKLVDLKLSNFKRPPGKGNYERESDDEDYGSRKQAGIRNSSKDDDSDLDL